MQTSPRVGSLVCAECKGGMARVDGVPVLQSLASHEVYGCGDCGHILLVAKDDARALHVGWLPFGTPDITCVALA